jgi:hypothetical protein
VDRRQWRERQKVKSRRQITEDGRPRTDIEKGHERLSSMVFGKSRFIFNLRGVDHG